MAFADSLVPHQTLIVRQRFEIGELFNFETRNRYAVESETGVRIVYAAEQQKGVLGFFMRQFFGHWRRFEILFLDPGRKPVLRAIHPFRILFQRLEVFDEAGAPLGALQQRFAILTKRFDIEDAHGRVVLEVASPFWKIWTFVFERQGREAARIEKKWSGLLAEGFTDKDRFRIQFGAGLSPGERQLLVAAAIFVDLQYFERKGR